VRDLRVRLEEAVAATQGDVLRHALAVETAAQSYSKAALEADLIADEVSRLEERLRSNDDEPGPEHNLEYMLSVARAQHAAAEEEVGLTQRAYMSALLRDGPYEGDFQEHLHALEASAHEALESTTKSAKARQSWIGVAEATHQALDGDKAIAVQAAAPDIRDHRTPHNEDLARRLEEARAALEFDQNQRGNVVDSKRSCLIGAHEAAVRQTEIAAQLSSQQQAATTETARRAAIAHILHLRAAALQEDLSDVHEGQNGDERNYDAITEDLRQTRHEAVHARVALKAHEVDLHAKSLTRALHDLENMPADDATDGRLMITRLATRLAQERADHVVKCQQEALRHSERAQKLEQRLICARGEYVDHSASMLPICETLTQSHRMARTAEAEAIEEVFFTAAADRLSELEYQKADEDRQSESYSQSIVAADLDVQLSRERVACANHKHAQALRGATVTAPLEYATPADAQEGGYDCDHSNFDVVALRSALLREREVRAHSTRDDVQRLGKIVDFVQARAVALEALHRTTAADATAPPTMLTTIANELAATLYALDLAKSDHDIAVANDKAALAAQHLANTEVSAYSSEATIEDAAVRSATEEHQRAEADLCRQQTKYFALLTSSERITSLGTHLQHLQKPLRNEVALGDDAARSGVLRVLEGALDAAMAESRIAILVSLESKVNERIEHLEADAADSSGDSVNSGTTETELRAEMIHRAIAQERVRRARGAIRHFLLTKEAASAKHVEADTSRVHEASDDLEPVIADDLDQLDAAQAIALAKIDAMVADAKAMTADEDDFVCAPATAPTHRTESVTFLQSELAHGQATRLHKDHDDLVAMVNISVSPKRWRAKTSGLHQPAASEERAAAAATNQDSSALTRMRVLTRAIIQLRQAQQKVDVVEKQFEAMQKSTPQVRSGIDKARLKTELVRAQHNLKLAKARADRLKMARHDSIKRERQVVIMTASVVKPDKPSALPPLPTHKTGRNGPSPPKRRIARLPAVSHDSTSVSQTSANDAMHTQSRDDDLRTSRRPISYVEGGPVAVAVRTQSQA